MPLTNHIKKRLYARMDEGPFTSRDLQKIVDSIGGDTRHITVDRFLQSCRTNGQIICKGKGPGCFWQVTQ